jgi:hypothetical protein
MLVFHCARVMDARRKTDKAHAQKSDLEISNHTQGIRGRPSKSYVFSCLLQQYRPQGEVVRREDAGGDRGLEGYLRDNSGKVLIGVQAKLFLGSFRSEWWSEMDYSARGAIESNASDGQLRLIFFCTPLTFTAKQREKWEQKRSEWAARAWSFSTPQP